LRLEASVNHWRRLDISILPWMLLFLVLTAGILGFVAA